MADSKKELDNQEQNIEQLAGDIQPSKETAPDSLAEATTAPLSDDALGGTANQDGINKAADR